jgi:O-antigen/teichoic acid export membrane protein
MTERRRNEAPSEEEGSPNSTHSASESFDSLAEPEFERRTSAGLFLTAGWSAFNLAVGFAGNIALARLLVPHDFGVFAIGATVLLLVGALSDGGLAAGLLRRPEPPSRDELGNLVALHLTLTIPIAILGLAVGTRLGSVGLAVGIMLIGLPLGAFQTPGRMMFNRALLVQRISMAEVAATAAFYVWTITGAALGYGLWALVTGAIVRIVASVLVTITLSPHGFIPPLWAGARRLLPLFRFGIRFQSTYITMVARDQALAVVVGGIGGVATLGLWSFVYRLMQGPLVLFESVWRVSFPAMLRFLAAGRDPAPVIERSLGMAATAAGIVLVGVGASAPELVPAVFGEQWRAAGEMMPTACLAVLLWGPISVSTVGYLFAAGEPGVVLRGGVLQAITWIAVAAALLPVAGLAALGVGWLVSGLVDGLVLGRAVSARTGARFVRPLAPPVAVGSLALAAGWFVTQSGPNTAVSALLGALVAVALFLGVLLLGRRDLVVDTFRFGAGTVTSALRRSPAPAQATSPGPA